jgi:Bacterial Ig domain
MRLRMILALCAALLLTVGVNAALAGGGGSKTGQTCQKGKYTNLIRATNGTVFGSETECTSWVAKFGTSSVLPLAAQPCFNNGYASKVRADGTTFSSQAACTTYVGNGGTLYTIAQVKCLEPGWILRNRDDGSAVASGSQACIDLLGQNKLLGVKLAKSYNATTNVVGWSLSAFGVDPSDADGGFCSFPGGGVTAQYQYYASSYHDPWTGGTECLSSTPFPIAASGLYSTNGAEGCPVGPANVDQVGAVTGWSWSWEFWGGQAYASVGVASSDFCGPLQTLVNSAPTAVDDLIQLPGGNAPYLLNPAGNDTDPDGNALRVAPWSWSDPEHGTISYDEDFFNGQVLLYYTPDSPEVTSDSFTYQVQDRGLNSANTATVTIQFPPAP